MKNRTTLSSVAVFFIGVAIGIAIAILSGVILSYISSGTPLTNRSKTFGDIKVWVQKPLVAEDAKVPLSFYQECDKELVMTMHNIPFLRITQGEAGKIGRLYLLKNKYRPVFWMEPLGSSGKWGNAMYSAVKLAERPVGVAFKDIDFDGRFDFKLVADPNTEHIIVRSIFINGSWHEVDHCSLEQMKATVGETKYTFDLNRGSWQQEK